MISLGEAMENEEVNLLRLLEVVWLKKRQILLHTLLAVACVGLVAYCIPRPYETHITAFVYPAESGVLVKQNILPEEYYKEFARSPEVLTEVLQKLPDKIKLDAKISSLESLASMLRVETKVAKAEKDLAGSALMVTYFVRHTDPASTFQIGTVWREVLDGKMEQDGVAEFSRKHHEIETQLEVSRVRLETVKTKLAETEGVKNNVLDLGPKQRELNSIQRLIAQGYADYEFLKTRMDAEKSGIAQIKMVAGYQSRILELREEYLAVKAFQRLAGLQPQTQNLLHNGGEVDIADGEFRLKALSEEKAHLERLVKEFRGEAGKSKPGAQTSDPSLYRVQINFLKNNISRYEQEAAELNGMILQKKQEYDGLIQEKEASVKLFQEASKNLEAIKKLQPESFKRLSFASSAVQPVIAIGNPVKVGILGAVIFGLPLAIILALLQVHFAGKAEEKAEEKIEKKPVDSQLPEKHRAEAKPFRATLDAHEATTPLFQEDRAFRFPSVVVSFAEER